MYKQLFFGGLLVAGATASIIRQEIIAGPKSCDVKAKWDVTNELNIVPLSPLARTGLIPAEVEEGLLSALGPRFLNPILEDAQANVHSQDLKCWTSCAGSLIKLGPCLAMAAITKSPTSLLACGLNKGAICDCVKCLPDAVKPLTNLVCDKSDIPATAMSDEVMSYPDYIQYSTRAPYLQGFRGDLKQTAVDEAKNLYNASRAVGMLSPSSVHANDIAGFCPGAPCGSCGCCLGVCVFGGCVGACI